MPRSPAIPELNFVVVGARNAGKSTFIQCALDLKKPPLPSKASKKMSLEGEVFLISLIELQLSDIDVAENAIIWPHSLQDAGVFRIDGVLALYDVTEHDSLSGIPALLNACSKTNTSCVLVSCKCDALTTGERAIDPREVERSCMAETGIESCQTLLTRPETHKRCISVVLRNFISSSAGNTSRPRALTANQLSKKLSSVVQRHGHSRAASEVMTTTPKSSEGLGSVSSSNMESLHSSLESFSTRTYRDETENDPSRKNSSSEGLHLNLDHLNSPDMSQAHTALGTPTTIANSFLDMGGVSDEDSSIDERESSKPIDVVPEQEEQNTGRTFNELVDRLLSLPMSKADSKFISIFLCLYRKFAAPAQLLAAICARFEKLSHNGDEPLLRMSSQLRYLSILAQWISEYPGDFAYPVTRKHLLWFINEISANQLFAAAAGEVKAQVETPLEDDDALWLCSDQGQGRADILDTFRRVPSMKMVTETFQTGADEEEVVDTDTTSSSKPSTRILGHSKASSSISSAGRSESLMSVSSSRVMNSIDVIQRQAELLNPISRTLLAKPQWHQFMETSEEDIARELTRIDWIMYSAIRPRDLIRHVSLTPDQKLKCKSLEHVNRMINQFNHVAFWVANMILLRDKAKHRAQALEKFMGIAWRLRQLNNYNSLGAVIAGINGTAVHRLLQTRELVSAQARRDFMRLEILMGTQRSHFAYRLAWDNTVTDKIPFLPLHRRDLVSAEEGNRTFITDDPERINWSKFEVMGETVVGIQKSQGTLQNPIQRNVDIQRLILDGRFSKDDDELYERSLQVEGPGANEPRRRFNWFRERPKPSFATAEQL